MKSILSPRSEEEVRKAIPTAAEGRAIRSHYGRWLSGVRWGGSSSGLGPMHLDLRGSGSKNRCIRSSEWSFGSKSRWNQLVTRLIRTASTPIRTGVKTDLGENARSGTGIDQVSIARLALLSIHGQRSTSIPAARRTTKGLRPDGTPMGVARCAASGRECTSLSPSAIGGYGLTRAWSPPKAYVDSTGAAVKASRRSWRSSPPESHASDRRGSN